MDRKLFQDALELMVQQADVNMDQFIDRFPHVSTDLTYSGEENKLWTAAFWPGLFHLAYQHTGDEKFLRNSAAILDSFTERLEKGHTETHDLGFLYTLSSVAQYKLNGNERAKELAVRAAKRLTDRYHAGGKYIQAWEKIGVGYPEVKIIIDTMLNLPLLYWASQATGDPSFAEMAKNHAHTAAANLVRDDYTTYHTFLMNPEDGQPVVGKTHQGHADESTWGRGQAWSIYGFALSYRYTKDAKFLQVARKCADWFMEHLPKDLVPYWDFDFTDENPDIKDSSAGSIAACGLLEISRYLPVEEGAKYRKMGLEILNSLIENYLDQQIEPGRGLLLEGVYHRNMGAEEFTAWGDYFFGEALMRVIYGEELELFW